MKTISKLIIAVLIGFLPFASLWAENLPAGDALKVAQHENLETDREAQSSLSEKAVASTPLGKLRGQVSGDVVVWRGIPYARPPVGKLRFKAPVPVEPWPGIMDATVFGPAAPQPGSSSDKFTGEGAKQSEDCLRLNIWARSGAKDRPVMVWYHGGAYMSGEGSLGLYDGREMAHSADVVLVTVNYRLGALGCMHFEDVAKEAGIAEAFDDNPALRDQVAALAWINGNISAFGGNPDNVTIFGESAGGSSVIALLCTPSAKGLFHRVIAQSPAPSMIYGRETGTEYALQLLGLLGLKPSEIGQLQEMPVERLVWASQALLDKNAVQKPGTLPFGPTYGTVTMPLSPLNSALSGRTASVPLIIGTNRDEATLFKDGDPPILPVTPELMNRMLEMMYAESRDVILSAYPDYPSRPSVFDAATDAVFSQPCTMFADAYSLHGPVWVYRFDYVASLPCILGMGATHGSEIVHIFHTYKSRPGRLLSLFSSWSKRRMLGKAMQGAWVNFALYGDPNRPGSEEVFWPAYETSKRPVLIFGPEIRQVIDPERKRREAWEKAMIYR